jgi:hypothetical protein
MRSHGVPDYPDPNHRGQLPKITPSNESRLGVSQSRFNSASAACQRLWPYSKAPSQAQRGQELAYALKFARCMRSHGVPNWPDPTTDPDSGRVEFTLDLSSLGISVHSPEFMAKAHECERGIPASMLPGHPDSVQVRTTP